jgi:hypothetical protein
MRDTTHADAEAVADLIRSSGLKAEAFDDLRPALWAKLIFNATVNAVAALTGLPHEPRFAQLERPSDLGHLVLALMDEGKAVAAAAGVELREDPWEMNVHATQRGSRHYPSMLEDVEAHRSTEIRARHLMAGPSGIRAQAVARDAANVAELAQHAFVSRAFLSGLSKLVIHACQTHQRRRRELAICLREHDHAALEREGDLGCEEGYRPCDVV